MDTHVAVLPIDIIDTLATQLNEKRSPSIPSSARFLRLPHPRTGIASLFLPYELNRENLVNTGTPKSSILEVQAVTPPNARSWFIEENVVSDGKLLIMTPVDPVFLLIPILQSLQPKDGSAVKFRPADDIFTDAAELLATGSKATATKDPSSLIPKNDIATFASLDCVKRAMKRVCEVKEITPEIRVFKFSPEKLLQYLRAKVDRLSTPRVLEMSRGLIRGLAKDGLMEDGKEDLLALGRIRSACDLVAQYIPQDIYHSLLASYDFKALEAYLKGLQTEQFARVAATNPTKTKITKTASTEDAGKKRKAKGSQGVEKLKKANTNGMSKLSSFFKKTAED
ncbi:ribonuclease H2, subunit B [Hygrophoropsis aurantiaca]|uniref:Ribonuclease H2, subunit B n=1 Tax=Hygrophoropsis aurantiaca TaxID=72124 RepID=A0ACB8AL67_9AGAM|nr:ribonuclease H2, subunit B [Hygrophoropsis aurantiaca]